MGKGGEQVNTNTLGRKMREAPNESARLCGTDPRRMRIEEASPYHELRKSVEKTVRARMQETRLFETKSQSQPDCDFGLRNRW